MFERTWFVELTARQKEVLDFIRQQQRDSGLPPTSREIQLHFHFQSQTAAMNHLKALEKKGAVQRTRGKARAVFDPQLRVRDAFQMVPVLGAIPAGLPIDAAGQGSAEIGIDPKVFGVGSAAEVFALQVRGDSMIGAHISDGDTVLVQKRAPRPGEIVAALIDGEVTLKRFCREGGKTLLRAENPAYPDLTPSQALEIQGVVVGLMRRVGAF